MHAAHCQLIIMATELDSYRDLLVLGINYYGNYALWVDLV
jgi:hypothetical protein